MHKIYLLKNFSLYYICMGFLYPILITKGAGLMKYRTNDTINQEETMEKWLRIYELYHSGQTSAAVELALEAMAKIITKYCTDAKLLKVSNYRLQDIEDLEQSLKTVVIMRLPAYSPYTLDEATGEQKTCLGSTFLTYWLKEVYSDFIRGGDGFGNGSVPKYYEKKNGKPQHNSYEGEMECPTGMMTHMSSRSAEAAYFDKLATEELAKFNAFTSKYSGMDKQKAALL